MSKTDDLPDLWTHAPHGHLVYHAGDKVADINTSATPGFKGKKADLEKCEFIFKTWQIYD